MKEHLMYDHNCNENSSNSSSSSKLSLESSDSEAKKSKSKAEIKTSASKQQKIQSRHSIATSSVQNNKEDPSKSKYNLRKRRRSTLSDENAEFKLDDDLSSLDNDINENEEYDADADENEKEAVKSKSEKKEKDVHIQQIEENKKDEDKKDKNKSEDVYDFESNESKLKKPQTPAPETKPPPKTRGRKPSLATQLKNSQPESPVIAKKVEEIEPIPAVEDQTPTATAGPPPTRKPKALKQTNIKKQPKTGQTRRTYRNRSVSHDVDGEKNFDESPSSPTATSQLL